MLISFYISNIFLNTFLLITFLNTPGFLYINCGSVCLNGKKEKKEKKEKKKKKKRKYMFLICLLSNTWIIYINKNVNVYY